MCNRLALPTLARAVIGTAFAAATALVASPATAQTYTNSAPITIPSLGQGTPYPSAINVANAPTSLSYLTVTLHGLSHNYVSDLRVLLAPPTGQAIILMAACNGNGDAVDDTITFVPDEAPNLPSLNENLASGVYLATAHVPVFIPDPAPANPYGTSLAPLIGSNANGTWRLFVFDAEAGDSGSIARGWSITFNQLPSQPVPTAFTYQGRLLRNGNPVTGPANVRFTLCNHPTRATSIAGVAPATVRSFTGVQDGLITTPLDFGAIVDTAQALWLNIEVDSPPGSGFQTLTPRQPLTPVPQARAAATVPWSGITNLPAIITSPIWNRLAGNAVATTAGTVGIGTTTPDSSFSVHAVTNADTQIALTGGPVTGGNTPPRTWSIQSSAGAYGPGNALNGSFQIVDRSAGASRLLIDSSGNVGIGITAPGQRLTVNGNVQANNVFAPSSARFKHNVAPLPDALERLLRIDGVSFDWNPEFAKDRPGREHDIGFVAEDVAKVFPEVVFFDPQGNVTGMDYARLTAVAVQAIKQQHAQRQTDRAQLEALQAENANLKARLDRLERLLAPPTR